METQRHIIHTKEKKRPPSEMRAPDRVRRPLWRGAWMNGPTRPLQVTCTLVARWWASSLLPGAQAARQSWQSGASRPRPSCFDPDHRTQDSPKTRKRQKSPPHTTHDLAPKEKKPPRRKEHTRHHHDNKTTNQGTRRS